jgi:hypothetical protein
MSAGAWIVFGVAVAIVLCMAVQIIWPSAE